MLTGRQGRQIYIEHQHLSRELMLPALTVRAKDLIQCRLHIGHVLLAGSIEGLGNARLFRTSRQLKGGDQRRIDTDRGRCVADGFGSCQHSYQEHLQLLHRGILEHFLFDLHVSFQWLKKVHATKMDS
jgi:hypothetical protein